MSGPTEHDSDAVMQSVANTDHLRLHARRMQPATSDPGQIHNSMDIVLSKAQEDPTQGPEEVGMYKAFHSEHLTSLNRQNSSMVRRRTTAPRENELVLSGGPRASRGSKSLPKLEAQQDAVHQHEPQHRATQADHPAQTRSNRIATSSETLQEYYRQLDSLRQKRMKHIQTMEELSTNVNQGKIVYGQLTHEWLQIGRARDLKRKHITEDEDHLLREQQSMRDTDEGINSLLAAISRLALGAK